MDPSADLLIAWKYTDARAVPLLRRAGAAAVFAPFTTPEASTAFMAACRQAGIVPVAELGQVADRAAWQARAQAAQASGFGGLAWDGFGDARATAELAASRRELVSFVYLKPEQLEWKVPGAQVVLKSGQWPGVQAPDTSIAAATAAPWLDANAHVVAYMQGLYPGRPALLSYRPDKDAGISPDRVLPFDSLELVLADARASGGNVVVSFPDSYASALMAGDAKALAALDSLGRMARFLGTHGSALRQPGRARVAVAAGSFDESFEVLNMMYRNNVCPVVVRAGAPVDAKRFRVLAAANLAAVGAEGLKQIMSFANAGGVVLAAPSEGGKPWWDTASLKKLRGMEERDVYAVGAGQLIAYREPVADPTELALDAIDVLGMQSRDVRLWMANTVIAQLHEAPGGGATLALVNYGGPVGGNFLARVEGGFSEVVLHAPERENPVPLKPTRRGSGTEFHIEEVRRVAIVALKP